MRRKTRGPDKSFDAFGARTIAFYGRRSEVLRGRWVELLPDRDKAKERPADQPFYLHALAQSLRLMGDPDADAIDGGGHSNFADGVHIGH